MYLSLIEGNLEVRLPTIWTDEKPRWEESEKKVRREEKRRERQRKSERKKMQVHAKIRKFRNTVFFSNNWWLRRGEE